MTIGVLALQGDFDLHGKALARIGEEPAEVRLPRELERVDGLVMPGGESTTLLKLLDAWEFIPALEKIRRVRAMCCIRPDTKPPAVHSHPLAHANPTRMHLRF